MSPNLNRLLLTLLIVVAVITIPLAAADKPGPVGWSDNFEQAKAQAQKTGLPILADFTGSDWCGWCIRLKDEVFDTPMFKEWASANAVFFGTRLSEHQAPIRAVAQAESGIGDDVWYPWLSHDFDP